MECNRQCSYRTPYGYCSVTSCYMNLGTTYAEPRHFKKDMSEEYIWRINNDGTDVKIQKVVRCKDCKHSVPDILGDKIEGYECDLCYDSYWDADDFCSRGERKDD